MYNTVRRDPRTSVGDCHSTQFFVLVEIEPSDLSSVPKYLSPNPPLGTTRLDSFNPASTSLVMIFIGRISRWRPRMPCTGDDGDGHDAILSHPLFDERSIAAIEPRQKNGVQQQHVPILDVRRVLRR